MKKQEWVENFASLMGRNPNPQEIVEAAGKGLFEADNADEKLKQEWAKNFEQLMRRVPNEKELADAEENGLFKNALADDIDTSELITTEAEVTDDEKIDFPVKFQWYSDVRKNAPIESLTVYANAIVDDNKQLKIDFELMKNIQTDVNKLTRTEGIRGTEHQVDDVLGTIGSGIINGLTQGGVFGLGKTVLAGPSKKTRPEKKLKTVLSQAQVFVEYWRISIIASYLAPNGINASLLFKGAQAETGNVSARDLVNINEEVFAEKPITVSYTNGKVEYCSFSQMVNFLQYALEEFRKNEIAEKMASPNPYDGKWRSPLSLRKDSIWKIDIHNGRIAFNREYLPAQELINGKFDSTTKYGRISGEVELVPTEYGTGLQVKLFMVYGIAFAVENRKKIEKAYWKYYKDNVRGRNYLRSTSKDSAELNLNQMMKFMDAGYHYKVER